MCMLMSANFQDLEDFVSGGNEGFVFVSMGSLVKTAIMPETLRKIFIKAFSVLPYRVLWKWEANDNMPDLPRNVQLGKWLPQQDILGTKLFLSSYRSNS